MMNPSIKPNLSLIGVAIDLGAGTRGVSLGPAAIRYAGVYEKLTKIGYSVKDEGDIVANTPLSPESDGVKLKNLDEIVRVNTELCNIVSRVMKEDRFPL